MKKFFVISIMFVINAALTHAQSHSLFTEVLAQHVAGGKVDYGSLRKDARLEQYIQQLSATNPDKISSKDEQLAFWINAYNAYTLKVICDNYPVKSINDLHSGGLIIGTVFKSTVWDRELVTINGKRTTLNEIEHKIIRKNFKEPRIHFALVCAARSCPPLRSEAYEGDRLNAQLYDQGRKFLRDQMKNSFDAQKKRAEISKIFDWFDEDFGDSDENILRFIAEFLPENIAAEILNNVKSWDIAYKNYDWNLNKK